MPMYLCVTAAELCCRDRRAGPPCLFRAIHFPRGAHRKGDASGRSGDRPLRAETVRLSRRGRCPHRPACSSHWAIGILRGGTPLPARFARHLPRRGRLSGCRGRQPLREKRGVSERRGDSRIARRAGRLSIRHLIRRPARGASARTPKTARLPRRGRYIRTAYTLIGPHVQPPTGQAKSFPLWGKCPVPQHRAIGVLRGGTPLPARFARHLPRRGRLSGCRGRQPLREKRGCLNAGAIHEPAKQADCRSGTSSVVRLAGDRRPTPFPQGEGLRGVRGCRSLQRRSLRSGAARQLYSNY